MRTPKILILPFSENFQLSTVPRPSIIPIRQENKKDKDIYQFEGTVPCVVR